MERNVTTGRAVSQTHGLPGALNIILLSNIFEHFTIQDIKSAVDLHCNLIKSTKDDS